MTAIVVDTSAIVAIPTEEPGAGWLRTQLASAEERFMASPNALELGIVLEARAPSAMGLGQRALAAAEIHVVSFDSSLAERGISAWRRFGKGRHPAGLNVGDCATYALAEHLNLSILCTGNDFARTDLAVLKPS